MIIIISFILTFAFYLTNQNFGFLVLTRKPLQKIRINDDIIIEIIKVKENKVTIGIAAPKNINIRRK